MEERDEADFVSDLPPINRFSNHPLNHTNIPEDTLEESMQSELTRELAQIQLA